MSAPLTLVSDPPEAGSALIVWHELQADTHAAQVEVHRWAAAELIVSELDTGKSQRRVATEIGKSQSHVKIMARVWREYREYHGTQTTFAEVYRMAKKAEPSDKRKTPREEAVAKIRRELGKLADLALAASAEEREAIRWACEEDLSYYLRLTVEATTLKLTNESEN